MFETPRSGQALVRRYQQAPRESIHCPLCMSGPGEHTEVLSNDIFSMRLRTVICGRCALVFTNPRPTPEVIERFYREDYQMLYNEIGRPDEEYVSRRRLDAEAAFRAQYYGPYLRDGMRLLEVGAGTGSFLTEVRRRYPGAVLEGIEPSGAFASYASRMSGVQVIETSAEKSVFPPRTFDVLAMFHVLEHLMAPLPMLRRLRETLAPGGRLLLEVPNVLGSWKGIGMFHVAHTCAYSSSTLTRIATAAGFEVERLDDRDHPRLESALFLVARRNELGEGGEMAQAPPDELEHTLRWIRTRTRGALFARLKKAALLEARGIRRILSPSTSRAKRDDWSRRATSGESFRRRGE